MHCCGIMATQLLATLTTVHHLLKRGIIVHLVNLRHPFLSTPLDVHLVSQLERCCYVSSHELILSCSVFSKIDCSRVFLSSRCHVGWSSQSKTSRQRWGSNQHPWEEQLDREDRVSFMSPLSSYLTSWISGRDFCLVGVSCHSPRILFVNSCIFIQASYLNFWNMSWGLLEASKT